MTKVPRWAFEKFPEADPTLTTQMKSVGETMAIGRTFKESLQKALRGLEVGPVRPRLRPEGPAGAPTDAADRRTRSRRKLATPNAERIWYIRYAFKAGMTVEDVHALTEDRPVVPAQHPRAGRASKDELPAGRAPRAAPTTTCCCKAKQNGFSDRQLAHLWDTSRGRGPPRPQAARASTPSSSWSTPAPPSSRRTRRTTTRPTRTRTRRARRRQAAGHHPRRRAEPDRPGDRVRLLLLPGRVRPARPRVRVIMVNSNPETVSTDYDTSDHLFFEPLTVEDVLNICERMQPDGRDRAVRRADAAEPGAGPGGGRRADHRHQRRDASTWPRTASGSAR